MGKLSAIKMSEFERDRAIRLEKLRVLTSTHFDLNNRDHVKALKKYVDDFEFSANQMYLFQSMRSGLIAWGVSCLVGLILPIPNFVSYLFTTFFYFGVGGFILERFSMTDFYEQLTEMKTIYNWCLKGGNPDYSSAINNTDNLAYPDIQRMIKLIAPLCTADFMVAWPKEAKSKEQKGTWSSTLSSGYVAVSSAFSIFSSSAKSNVDLNRIRELKISVETRSFDIGIFNGFEQSMRYFATNPDFRSIMATKVRELIEMVKNMLPVVASGLSPSISSSSSQ